MNGLAATHSVSQTIRAARMLVFTMENETAAEKRRQQDFFDLARRYREEQDPDFASWLGDQLGRMIFGS